VTYTLPLRLRNDRALGAAAAPTSPEPETTGLSAGRPEAEAFAQSTSPSELGAAAMPSKPRRDIQPVSAPQQRPACIPSYDSSGAQTGAC
jgi:hypothetical protein